MKQSDKIMIVERSRIYGFMRQSDKIMIIEHLKIRGVLHNIITIHEFSFVHIYSVNN